MEQVFLLCWKEWTDSTDLMGGTICIERMSVFADLAKARSERDKVQSDPNYGHYCRLSRLPVH